MESNESCNGCDDKKRPIRNLTSLSLDWLAEKFRKKEELKEKVGSGCYSVDTDKLARSMVEDEESK